MRRFVLFAARATACFLVCAMSCVVRAQTVFTTDTVISTTQYENQDITIRGCNVSVLGTHVFRSITIERNAAGQPGVLSTAMSVSPIITVSTDMMVQGASGSLPACRIDVSGRGFSSGNGPGSGAGGATASGHGGTHGGRGGILPLPTNLIPGGDCYDQISSPSAAGSGGGNGCSATPPIGGTGGGVISLTVTGVLTMDGIFAADGNDGLTAGTSTCALAAGGGGAGGTISLRVGTLAGTGTIRANGGNGGALGMAAAGGGGGGGRIALVYTNYSFTGMMTAFGGMGAANGGAGSVYRQRVGAMPEVRYENNVPGGYTEMAFSSSITGTLYVGPNANLCYSRRLTGTNRLNLSVSGDLIVEAGGAISQTGLGFQVGTGSGAGASATTANTGGAGGGYGGAGGRTALAPVGGMTYGNFLDQATTSGSGGGRALCAELPSGGNGGGSILLNVFALARIDGTISADGIAGGRILTGSPQCLASGGGGGSGGGIYINARSIEGTGSITADGGAGGDSGVPLGVGGGGGGGRIQLVYATTNSFSGTLSAHGGPGYQRGGAGTIFVHSATNSPTDVVVIDNAGLVGASTEIISSPAIAANMIVRGGAIVGPRASPNTARVSMTISRDLTIEADGAISADAAMSAAAQGLGATDPSLGGFGSGAGFGGAGGTSATRPGGLAFGSLEIPVSAPGAGGAACGAGTAPGGPSGGAIRLTVGGTLRLNGRFSADGGAGVAGSGSCSPGGSGGGAGGSLWITAPSIVGTGLISARGGASGVPQAGGGGGGRIALYSCDSHISPNQISVIGGPGFENGHDGTLYLGSSAISISQQPQGTTVFSGSTLSLRVVASSTLGPLTYQWRKAGVNLADDARTSGSTSDTLRVSDSALSDGGTYDVRLSDSCGSALSFSVPVSARCTADVDDGTGNGTPDGGVTIDDLIYYVASYAMGLARADIDNGSGTGTPDGGVTIDDLLYFLLRFDAGC